MPIQTSILRQVPLFSSLSEDGFLHLSESMAATAYDPDTVLFNEGDSGDRLYILLEGQVEIIKLLGSTDQRLLGVRSPGEFFGEMSLINPDGLRTACARTRGLTRMLELSRADFSELLQRWPVLAFELMRVLSLRLNEAHNLAIHDLQEKNQLLTLANEEILANQAQLIEKEKLEHDMAVARDIQKSMLPDRLPRLKGYDFGALSVPSRAVGGDLYDFVPLSGGRLGITIGDVTDKGLPAAIFMALTRSLLRVETSRPVSPAKALRNVNRHLLEMNTTGLFVTVLFGILNPADRSFTYARAGHMLPLLVDAQGDVAIVPQGRGQPLGIFEQPELDEQQLTVTPGSLLVLYTDGFTEAANGQGEYYGLERLVLAVKALHRAEAQAACEGLYADVQAFHAAAVQDDDITAVVVKC